MLADVLVLADECGQGHGYAVDEDDEQQRHPGHRAQRVQEPLDDKPEAIKHLQALDGPHDAEKAQGPHSRGQLHVPSRLVLGEELVLEGEDNIRAVEHNQRVVKDIPRVHKVVETELIQAEQHLRKENDEKEELADEKHGPVLKPVAAGHVDLEANDHGVAEDHESDQGVEPDGCSRVLVPVLSVLFELRIELLEDGLEFVLLLVAGN
mmetsp:Transcript_50306/g.113017  ORF Transcript_50306/g.113017 Transcript_50306/m.113017 type:complete len:208 (-) Transcript_50306:77-700(-)